MDDKYVNETFDAINKRKEDIDQITRMNNYVTFERQRIETRHKQMEENRKKNKIKQAIATLVIVASIAGAGYGINKAVDVKNYSTNPPRTQEEIDQEKQIEMQQINGTDGKISYEEFQEYTEELREKYPDAPESFFAPTKENMELAEQEIKSRGGM